MVLLDQEKPDTQLQMPKVTIGYLANQNGSTATQAKKRQYLMTSAQEVMNLIGCSDSWTGIVFLYPSKEDSLIGNLKESISQLLQNQEKCSSTTKQENRGIESNNSSEESTES